MRYQCTVCGYWQLTRPPQDDTICPCCGTHFGYHDYATTHEELRRKWISSGAHWFSRAQTSPVGWDPFVQLIESRLIPFQLAGVAQKQEESSVNVNADTNTFRWATAAAA